jgi:bacteriocin-like protein
MNTLKMNTYNVTELNDNTLSSIYGGGIITDIAKAIGYAVGYAAGAIQDAITEHGNDAANAGNASAVIAYK